MKTRILRHLPAGLVLPALALTLVGAPASAATLLGADQFGTLVSIDTNTGIGTPIGVEPNFPLSTEIEFDQNTGRLWSDEWNGFTNLHEIDPNTGLSLGFVNHACCALNGMEFVGATLYATNNIGGISSFVSIDPNSGVITPIGAVIDPPTTGLAYDTGANTMYGMIGGGSPAQLVTINIANGVQTPGPFVFDAATGAQLDRIGSIEFGSDGVLYGGMGLGATINPGWLISIDVTTGAATFIGPTGLFGITGLTSPAPPIGACCTDGPNEESECIEVTEADCDLAGPQGGLFLGAGTSCDDVDDCVPLVVEMDSMSANAVSGGVAIHWSTALELDTMGFHVVRQIGNGREKKVESIGFVGSSATGVGGASYVFYDNSREAGLAQFYFLVDVDVFGRETQHGPILVDRGGRGTPSGRVSR